MKKIGILTINDNDNYGNRLQNYAVQSFLINNNCKVETIINTTRRYKNTSEFKTIIKNIKYKIKCELNPRKKYFRLFNKNIIFSSKKINYKKIPVNLNNKYDYFITGSDQVWNPNLKRFSEIDFLKFADKKKRISFSASIGVSELTDVQKKIIKKNIADFKNISVREQSAKEIIEKLTGRNDVEVLIDPTMLLTSEEWDRVSKKPQQLNEFKQEKYILNYFLGKLSESRKQIIEKIAKENNCAVINILDKNDPFNKTGPSEFLYLEKNAFLICTDSFHSCVFSILYNRPFIVFNRDENVVSMNTRIDTLLSKFKLEDRRFNGKNITKENLNHDYTEAYKILEKERKKSEEFLKKALDIE